MRRHIRLVVIFSVCMFIISCVNTQSTLNTFPPTTDNDIIGYLLASKGLTRETARVDAETLESLAKQQAMLQPHFLKYWKNPYDFPKFVYSLVDQQALYAEKDNAIYEQFSYATARTGHRINISGRMEFVPSFTPKTPSPVEESLEGLFKRCGITFTDKANVAESLKGVPADLQLSIAKLIFAAGEAKYYRDRALRNYPQVKWQHAFDYATKAYRGSDDIEDGEIINWDLGQCIDYDDLYTGAVLNIKAILEFQNYISKTREAPYVFELNTPLGKIAFNGKNENNTYDGKDYCLIIDLVGNDTYNGPAAASYSLAHPISIIMDFSGNDSYASGQIASCSQGAGIMGYGFLLDYAGDDTFKAIDNAQGMCYFGVGFLWDRGGNDSFKAEYAAQGSAAFGVTSLMKIGGNDNYYCYSLGQGFGFVGGYGCLLDTSGNDKYVAEPYNPLFNPAKGGHDNLRNYNFCQGAGWGQRGDIFGGHPMAGGTGVLQDLAGDDWYECGVYGQATGYWYGTGVLHDKSGNDHYEGSFFCQSGTAHMGLTMLLDEAGNDTHHVWHAISLGGAHDFSVSYFIDKGGDDKTSCWEWKDKDGKQTLENTGKKGSGGGVLVGGAITNSVGIYIKIGGSDTYEIYANDLPGLCSPNVPPGSWRYDLFTIGMFIHVGGKATYNIVRADNQLLEVMPGSNKTWSMVSKTGNPKKMFGMGIDIEKGIVLEANR